MNLQNQVILCKALEFANWMHRNQRRKTTANPYIIHPFHVIMLLLMHGLDPDDDSDLEVLIASSFHDGPEDNPEEVSSELIEREFGEEVARIVRGVTLDPANPDKRLSRRKILAADWKIKIVKVADVLSNTIATEISVKGVGLENTQKHFKQPIGERIAMEQEFLGTMRLSGEPVELDLIVDTATLALDRLRLIV